MHDNRGLAMFNQEMSARLAFANADINQLREQLAAMTQRAEAAERERDDIARVLRDVDKSTAERIAEIDSMTARAEAAEAAALEMGNEWAQAVKTATALRERWQSAEAKLAAIPWDELHAVHMRATDKGLHDWLTVTDWLSRNTPEQQEAQP